MASMASGTLFFTTCATVTGTLGTAEGSACCDVQPPALRAARRKTETVSLSLRVNGLCIALCRTLSFDVSTLPFDSVRTGKLIALPAGKDASRLLTLQVACRVSRTWAREVKQ